MNRETSNAATPYERFRDAYKRMAREARYRPAAPGDGLGAIHLTKEQLKDPDLLEEEASRYARRFLEEEDTDSFWIGCSNYSTNRAFVYVIEAARVLGGGEVGDPIAVQLIEMALAEIQEASPM
jgi:hypothetical protein